MTEYKWNLPDNWDVLLGQSKIFDDEWSAWKKAGMPQNNKVYRTEQPSFKEEYNGWACVHGNNPPNTGHTGKSIEELITDISFLGGWVKIGVDQWWGIWVDGTIENWGDEGDPNWVELEFKTYIQSDTLLDGLEKTYDVWLSRWEFHHGRKYNG